MDYDLKNLLAVLRTCAGCGLRAYFNDPICPRCWRPKA